MKIVLYTIFALTAFALNSILCRLALRGDEADAAGFTAVRLVSGAAALALISIAAARGGRPNRSDGERDALESASNSLQKGPVATVFGGGSWLSAAALFAYAICFSIAYLGLTAGTGALILFGSVQLTMIATAIGRGERPRPVEWLGFITAVAGLVYLVLPGLESPPLNSSLLMAAAGASWGVYTLRGKGTGDPLASTTGNFARTIPFAAAAAAIYLPNLHISGRGMVLAVLSGAIASGIGYAVWYAAIKHHTATRTAVLQLSVPVIAAALGVFLLGETTTPRLAIAASLILGGIGVSILGGKKAAIR